MNHRIVIAEDEPDIRSNLARLLTLENYVVWAGANGEEALALVREHRPDLLLSDVMMPRMDGHQLIRALRADPDLAHIPAILLTAKAEHRDRREGMNLGADDYLIKPFRRDELLEAVRSRLDRVALQQVAHERLQQEAQRLSRFDGLTGLPNREALLESCAGLLGANTGLSLVVVGMEGVGHINQTWGHAAGDQALCTMAQRLQAFVTQVPLEMAQAYRVSGRHCGLLLPGAWDSVQLAALLAPLSESLAQAFQVQGRALVLRSRLGVALAGAGVAASDLLRQAEAALHQDGDAPLVFFDPAIDVHQLRRMQLRMDLHQALDRAQLTLHYQPQVELVTGRLVGFEALMRWTHPELGKVPPGEFIPLAEESDLVVNLGRWALDEACRQARAWKDSGLPAIRVAVNLSSRQFDDPSVMDHVQTALQRSAIGPECLELEITESIALKGLDRTVNTLTAFKRAGLALSIDDFGTGYSSLSYLKRFPVDALKIDQSFVRNIDTDSGDAAIARAVVGLAHNFGMKVIAEGVERPAHLSILQDMGCDFAQGYLFSRPLPPEQAQAVLARGYCPVGSAGDQ